MAESREVKVEIECSDIDIIEANDFDVLRAALLEYYFSSIEENSNL